MQTVYDEIAQSYKEWQNSLKRKFALEDTFFQHLGKVKGKSVLDAGCGAGYYTRKIKKLGAVAVVGVDVSQNMLEEALEEEKKEPLGIKYEQYSVAELPKLGEFDVVTAAYLLHYSKTRNDLFRMCKSIGLNLKKRGRFVTLNLDPCNPSQPDKKYDCTIETSFPLKEGAVVSVTAYLDERKICSFDNYHWEKSSYENALRAAGFKTVKWNRIKVSRDGVKQFGKKFWENYLKQPGVALLECIKG